MNLFTRRNFLGSLSAAAATPSLLAQQRAGARAKIKITDLRCAIIGGSPVVRIVTDQGVSGYGQAESRKAYLKPMVLFYKDYILGEDPTDVERVMMRIRRLGAFKPWGAAVSAIEIALWDIAGQVAGVPVYKLLGGKIRDRVRIYNGGFRPTFKGQMPEHYADVVQQMKEAKEGFTLIKMAVGFHNAAMMRAIPDMWYDEPRGGTPHGMKGQMTERGLKHVIACVEAMKKVLGDQVGLALDAGPGWMPKDAVAFARACEPLNLVWIEDMLTGDYTPYPNADLYRDLRCRRRYPSTPGSRSTFGRTSRI
jgi:L-alanine-DL-glutamate epimerase-like enolase superfamily enzyme